MKNGLLFIVMCTFLSCSFISKGEIKNRTVIQFDKNWKFKLLEQGNSDEDFQNKNFDDGDWRILDLPHDWGIEKGFDNNLENNTGLLPWKGIGWYRNYFELKHTEKNKRIFVEFDGAMANAEIYCNGKLVGKWPYGYTSFSMDLTNYVACGEKNLIAVKLNTEKWDSRWYPGAGLYRKVRIVKTNNVFVPYNGVFITTPEINQESAVVSIQTDIENASNIYKEVQIEVEINKLDDLNNKEKIDFQCKPVNVQVQAGKSHTLRIDAMVNKPSLWSIEKPNRYIAKLIVKDGSNTIDSYEQTFGFRTIEFTPRKGFFLNGQKTMLKGVCNHHDLGPLGGAFYVEAAKRQLVLLKEMGCNAIRTSHNPPAPELLELCDKMGFLVQVEAFDCWRRGKRKNDYNKSYNAWHVMDLKAMVKRDRNHPSVIMWSSGNEMPDQWNNYMSVNMYNLVKSIDPTRPVTMGCNWGGAATSGFQKGCDIFGFNYNHWAYDDYFNHKDNQLRGVYASETSSCLSSRGEYFFPVREGDANNNLPGPGIFHMSSYDVNFPGWGCKPDAQFEKLKEYPAMYGEFVWTGFDYLGEPTPYNNDITNLLNYQDESKKEILKKQLDELGKIEVPSRSSYFGIMDLCGFKKDRFYIYQAQWRPDYKMAHILPHWNWKGKEGKNIPVHVYTSGDEAELFLNGKSLGRKKKEDKNYRIVWDNVNYKQGKLEVIAYKNGELWAKDFMETTKNPYKIELKVDSFPVNNKSELLFVTVDVKDRKNKFVPTAKNELCFEAKGAEIIATGNGDPTDHTPFFSDKRDAYNGKCLVILKKIENNGKLIVKGAKLRKEVIEW